MNRNPFEIDGPHRLSRVRVQVRIGRALRRLWSQLLRFLAAPSPF